MKLIIKLLFVTLFVSNIAFAQGVIICNKSNPKSTLTAEEARHIYELKTNKWDDGTKIIVFDNADESAKSSFYTFIAKSPVNLRKQWLKVQLTGKGEAPKALNSDSEVISKVSSTPGAIGFINKSNVTDAVKVLAEY